MSEKNGMGSRKRRKTRTGRLDMGNAEAADEMDDLDTEGPVAILWDIENCPIPAGVPPMDVSGNVRNSLMVHGGVKGGITTFSAYGDYSRLSTEIRRGCQNTGINLIDVPSGYKDAADKAILIDMFLFALDNRPPALILLISGDVDFAPALHKLRQRGYTIAVALPRVKVHSALSNAGKFVWDWHNMASNKSLGSISRFNLDIMAENFPRSSLNGGECQGHQPEPTNANDVDKQGLCSEEKIIDSMSPRQTEDINAFKDEIVRVVSMNGGKLCLERIASSYEKAFRKKISLELELEEATETNEVISNEDKQYDLGRQVDNAIRTNEEFRHSDRPMQTSAYGRGLPHIIKSCEKQWVEKDMAMELVDTIKNQHIMQKAMGGKGYGNGACRYNKKSTQ